MMIGRATDECDAVAVPRDAADARIAQYRGGKGGRIPASSRRLLLPRDAVVIAAAVAAVDDHDVGVPRQRRRWRVRRGGRGRTTRRRWRVRRGRRSSVHLSLFASMTSSRERECDWVANVQRGGEGGGGGGRGVVGSPSFLLKYVSQKLE